ncbi:carbon-nitrogen hydrolase family protein [Zhihengliuella halotolerans]|uniref:Putative amidohydrolase n=1 Tax=Zhihengliuella halotolerans TaxID=370736 RepID=A0A4Q8AGJ5_9MICC|nr:carbon-nitrogen hydrolase family protein [Zhihengliuella halotolerans]RZU63507.1 putative amidohydrolase [Zhihengliuella halotolerans]
MKISVAQLNPSGDLEDNLEVVRRLTRRARDEGADLVLFPEETMFTIRHVEGDLREAVDRDWSTFVQQLSLLAAEESIAIVAGGYESSGEARPYNTVVAIDGGGRIVSTYRKVHLFDAFSYKESERIKPGDPDDVGVIEIDGLRFGVMTCYDIRFPEIARRLTTAGADVLLVAAAWFKGDHKVEHWETILRTRAIENTVWVAAAGTSSTNTVGHSAVLDPMGIPVDFLDDEAEGLVTVDVTRKRIEEVREFLPVLANRRL